MFFFNLFGIKFVIFLVTVFVAIYFYLKRNLNYWKSRGVDGPKPIVGLGTMSEMFSKDIYTKCLENVKKYGKVYGIYLVDRPALTIADPELINDIMIKDFNVFVNRNDLLTGDPEADRSLFIILGDDWKKLRSIISPSFSSGKMRKMHPIIVDCVRTLEHYLMKTMKEENEVELKILTSNFTLDVIARCAFATKIDTYSDENNEFVVNARNAIRGNWRIFVFFLLSFISTKFVQWLQFNFADPTVMKFFKNAVKSIIARRETEKGKYNDFIELMLNSRDKSEEEYEKDIEDDNSEESIFKRTDQQIIKTSSSNEFKITETDILANSFVFFIAGFETTSATLSHLFYSLAVNEKCQQKLYKEIEKFGPEFSYEDFGQMPYLEACVAETLRLYNPISTSGRQAERDYKLGDTGITITKGMMINIDFHAVHHSPEYYPNPQVWDPERFMPENRNKLIPHTYMPFGTGPRNCVGMRFALMEVKTAAVYLLYKYRFFPTNNTQKELKAQSFNFILNVGDIRVGIEERLK